MKCMNKCLSKEFREKKKDKIVEMTNEIWKLMWPFSLLKNQTLIYTYEHNKLYYIGSRVTQIRSHTQYSWHTTLCNNNRHTIVHAFCVFKYAYMFILLCPFIHHSMMWNNLPSDLLANIFSYLPPPSLARAMAACRHWHDCGRSAAGCKIGHKYPPWFIALPTRNSDLCFVHNPIENTWHLLNLDYVPSLTRPMSTIGGHGLILFKSIGGVPIRLSVCNPFTGQYHPLPPLQKSRINPAVGVIDSGPNRFQLYVAGGMSEAASSGAASYEPTLELFDSKCNKWTVIGPMPVEFAIRLTVWTPNESVYLNGVLYWMTSARAYSIMGFEIGSNKWTELSVPMGDKLEFATLVTRGGKLAVVGGVHGWNVVVWERGEGGEWVMIEKMACELGNKFMSSKCVGIEGCVCLYKEIGSGMMVCRRDGDYEDKWIWNSIEGCNQVSGKRVENCPIKGLFLHPNLTHSTGLGATIENDE